MLIRAGYDIRFETRRRRRRCWRCSASIRRATRICVTPHRIIATPDVPIYDYRRRVRECLHARDRARGRPDALSCDFTIEDGGEPDRVAPDARQHAGRGPARRRARSTCSAAAIARPTGCPTPPGRCSAMSPPGWERVQAIVDFTHDHIEFGYHHARADQDGLGRASGAAGRLPRLRPSGDHAVPLHEHPGALLHRLSRRHRHPAGRCADGFLGLVRGLSRRRAGTRSTRATIARGSAAS